MHQALYIKIKSFVLIILLFVLSSCSEGDYKLAEGGSGKLDDFLGKWLVINYWADWCPPCIKEMPELESFYLENKSDVMVLAFNFDRLEGKELQDQISDLELMCPVSSLILGFYLVGILSLVYLQHMLLIQKGSSYIL